ncbi:hypothetical protein BT96DRAFT_615677 [Gymnopus androsaceus JB14]|uniref:Uncharacterized protein n=1 Tax=Gymnopus androsaceus JB14 TaxID=1447944 RepID=A0A6A4GHQ9_9AGAR|nr:hypothetical protein BT96DRAFT_615677 [Gymnopus androsaceus JB14]
MDMLPLTLEVVEGKNHSNHLELGQSILARIDAPGWQLCEELTVASSLDPLLLWSKFSASYNVQEAMIKEIADELDSSV